MINYGKQTIDTSDIKTVTKILKSNFLTQGPMIELFQNKIQSFFGSKYCTVVSNGTAGLYLAGKALKWKKGDKIITSPITFIASANAIVLSGAQPILVDIDAKTYNLDPNKVEEEITTAKRIFANKGWPVIDITRRSVEETASAIMNILSLKEEENVERK